MDTLVPTNMIITGIYAKMEISFSFMPLGKDTAIALRKERLAYQLEDAIGETEANKSKKRTTLSSTEMFVNLDLVVSYWQISSVHFIVHVQLCCYPGLFTPLAVQLHHDSLQLRHEQED